MHMCIVKLYSMNISFFGEGVFLNGVLNFISLHFCLFIRWLCSCNHAIPHTLLWTATTIGGLPVTPASSMEAFVRGSFRKACALSASSHSRTRVTLLGLSTSR